jgi:hypothetical protein
MNIDNFELIKSLLNFKTEDDFYHLQILKRKKENPELGSNSYVVKTYYVTSVEHLDKKRDEIINLCQLHNARAYINLNPRSFEKMAFHALKKITDQIMNRDYKSVYKAYESVAGTYGTGRDKTFLIDIDYKDLKDNLFRLDEIHAKIEELQTAAGHEPLMNVIPTKNGYHLITRPFNIKLLEPLMYSGPLFDIHKDNPTVLYL